MEDERFKQLYRLEENLYIDSAPLIVEKGNLLLDRQTDKILIQLKFHSLSEKKIKALTVKLNTYYASGERHPETVEYQYLDLAVEYGDRFGEKKAILLNDNVIRSFTIESYSVVYYDKTVEEIKGVFEPLPFPKTLLGVLKNPELQKQYWLETSKDSMVVPIQYKKLWKCACGEWNLKDTCSACKCRKSQIFSKLNVENLTVAMDERLKKEAAEREEQKRREEAEAKRQEAIQQEKEIRRKKQQKTIRRIAAPVILVGIFAFGIYPGIIKPNMTYKHARELLSEEKYDDSIDAFESLGDYKDSADMITQVKCQKAESLVKQKKYNAAREIYNDLEKYDMVNSVTYQEGKDLIADEKYEDAIDLLINFEYKDSEELLKEAEYGRGIELMEQKSYVTAIGYLKKVLDYKDAKSKIGECKYLIGVDYMKDENYNAALKEFELVKKYDNGEVLKKAEEKIEECNEKVNESNYEEANKLISNEKYEDAIEVLEKCEDYKDSKKKIDECKDIINKAKIETLFPKIKFDISPEEVENEFGKPDKTFNQTNYYGTEQYVYQYSNYYKLVEIIGTLNLVFEHNQSNEWSLQRVYWESNENIITKESCFNIQRYLSRFWGEATYPIGEKYYDTTIEYESTKFSNFNTWEKNGDYSISYYREEDTFGENISTSLTVTVEPSE